MTGRPWQRALPPVPPGVDPSNAAAAVEHLGSLLRAARKQRGLSIDRAAARLGVSSPTFGSWERGDRWPSRDSLLLLLRWLAEE